jgi:spore maturation protein CgeB
MRVRQLSNLVELLADNRRAIDKFRQRRMVKRVQEIRPDILLTIDRRLHPTVIKAAHQVGAKVALWFPDHTGTMANHDMFVAGYDRIYLKNPVLVDQLRDVQGLPVRYMPEAANSSWHRSILPYGAERAVVVAGNIHPTRALLLDRLVGDGIPVRIYGAALPSWIDFPRLREAHTGEYIARQRKADVFRSAVAVLNNLHPAEDAGMNCRLFEAAASGAVVVTEERVGLRDLFAPGEEVLTFDTYDGLVTTLRGLLGDSAVGLPVADAAASRAHREHTYEHRLTSILDDLTTS